MTFDEYFKKLQEIQNRLVKSNSPIISSHYQVQQMMQPLISYQQQIARNILPIINMQERLIKMFEPIIVILEQHSNNLSIFSSRVLNLLEKQQNVFSNFNNSNAYGLLDNISEDSSSKIRDISHYAITELDNFDYPDDYNDSKDLVYEYTTQKEPLTFEQVITIVTFIITIIMFIQSLMPNKQLANIENALEQIIEIEINELNSLNEQSDQ